MPFIKRFCVVVGARADCENVFEVSSNACPNDEPPVAFNVFPAHDKPVPAVMRVEGVS